MGIDEAKFRRPIVPAIRCEIIVEVVREKSDRLENEGRRSTSATSLPPSDTAFLDRSTAVIHPTAIVSPEAQIGADAHIGRTVESETDPDRRALPPRVARDWSKPDNHWE